MKAYRLVLLVLLAAAASRAPADAAVVRLKDGGRLEGTVVSQNDQEVILQTAGGPRRIAADQVRSIEYEAAAPPPGPAKSAEPALGDYSPSFETKNLFSVGMGLAAPLSSVDFKAIGGGSANNGDLGPSIGMRYLRSLSSQLALGFDVDYFHRGETDSPGLLPLADSSVVGDNLLLLAVGRWHIIKSGMARPYILAGAGASRSWTRIDSAPIRGFAWTDTDTDEARRLVDDGVWAFASTARAGIDFDWDFAEPAVFSLEAGWTGLASRSYAATQAGRDLGIESVGGRLNLFMLSARWSWRW